MSKVEENMTRASVKDAILTQKFWFKLNVVNSDCKEKHYFRSAANNCVDRIEELTLKEIFLGTSDFEGLLGLINIYLKEVVSCSEQDINALNRYLDLIRRRVNDETPTGAAFLRNFIVSHEDYKKDSIISQSIAFDLVKLCTEASDDWLRPRSNGN